MISFSASSNMFRLFQESLQLLAGTFHAHLQRRNARPGELRDLLVLEVFNVLEQKCLAVFRRQSRQIAAGPRLLYVTQFVRFQQMQVFFLADPIC